MKFNVSVRSGSFYVSKELFHIPLSVEPLLLFVFLQSKDSVDNHASKSVINSPALSGCLQFVDDE